MNNPTPFGYEQTIPSDRMIELLADLVPPNTKVLELGVGSGALAIELAKKCQEVVGIDVQTLPPGESLPSNVTLIRADACTYSTGEKFDAIVVSFGAEKIYPEFIDPIRLV
jgi:protein-L-isoaspartate O-methyltransferase